MLAWFYDVAKREKVQRPVVGKMVRMGRDKKARFSFVGKTVDGRRLVLMVSKKAYKEADVPRLKRG